MKKHLLTIVIILMFIVGLSVLLYPAISNYINSKHASRVISQYNDELDKMDEENKQRVLKEAEDYNRRLRETPSAFYKPSLVEGYESTLDITGNGAMGYIDIDRINEELPIYHTVEESVLQVGAGHLEGTSLPVGGRSTHCVLSGHRGLPSARLFTDLDELEIGDEFTITVLDRKLTYLIDQIKIVEPKETEDLMIEEGKDYCTLMTCTPYGINTHRLLVRGVRIENADEKPGVFVKNEAFRIEPLIVTPIVALPMLVAAFVFVLVKDKKRKKRQNAEKKEEQVSEDEK